MDGGKPYSSNDTIRKGIDGLSHGAGVPLVYKPNSTRHAALTALLSMIEDKEVNAFTGHTQRASTLLTHYYHLDKSHAAQRLASLTAQGPAVVTVPEKVQEILERDKEENGHDGDRLD
jgi:integrase